MQYNCGGSKGGQYFYMNVRICSILPTPSAGAFTTLVLYCVFTDKRVCAYSSLYIFEHVCVCDRVYVCVLPCARVAL